MLTESNTIIRRIRDINMSYPLLKDGLNPIGVRRFFETQVFSNPPIVELKPALLKPYILSRSELHVLPASSLPSVQAILKRIVITDENGQRLQSSIKKIPLPIYSGLFHGDTCAGDVFLKMSIGYEQQNTFASLEERNAFFLQICKLLIAGIEKDAGDSHINDCDNHGNFGECLSGLFDNSSAYNFPHLQDNHFLKNRVIMLLFHKIVEVNKQIRRTIDMNKSQQAVTNFSLTSNSEFGKIPHYVKKARQEALVSSTREYTKREQDPLIALAERYFDIAISLMHNAGYSSGQSVFANPLNIELCAAEVELHPTASDSTGLVRYVAKFANPRNPDGRTMAHLLAEECPRVLMRMMQNGEKGNNYFNVTTTTAYMPANPIAYLIADSRGETPKSLAMRKLYHAMRESSILPKLQQIESRAYEFFRALPEPQVEKVHIEREHFMKRHAGHSKLRSALSKASGRDVSEGLKKMFKSRRDFDDASKIESLLTGRQPSLMTGMRMKTEKSGNSDKSGFTVIPEGLGGGSGCGCGINLFGKTRRYRKRGGHRERTNGRRRRFGRKRKNTSRKYRNRK
jgi:hypothetical protein